MKSSEIAPMTNEAAAIPPNQSRILMREREDEACDAARPRKALLCCQSLNLLIRSD